MWNWHKIILAATFLGIACGLFLSLPAPAQRPAGLEAPLPMGAADYAAMFEQRLASGGTLRLEKGDYPLSRTVKIDLEKTGYAAISGDGTARIIMQAAGPAFFIRGTHTKGTADPTSVAAAVWERERTPTIVGVEIIGRHQEADAITADGTMQLTLERVSMRNCRHGLQLVNRNRNVLINACHIYDNSGVGIYLAHVNLHQINIAASHISYCKQGGVVVRGGDVRNIQISGCDIESNMAAETPATANVLLDSTNGSVGEVAITGCTIQHNNKGPDSANIRILGRGDGGAKIGPTREGHVTISNNVLSDVQHNIDLEHCRGVTITGNTFWMGYEYNLRAVHCSQLVLAGNVLERNPRYDYGTSKETHNAVLFRDCEDCTISSLHAHRIHGVERAVELKNCRRFNLQGCTILDCAGVALSLENVTESLVTGCLIRNSEAEKGLFSVVAKGCQGTEFFGNQFGNPTQLP